MIGTIPAHDRLFLVAHQRHCSISKLLEYIFDVVGTVETKRVSFTICMKDYALSVIVRNIRLSRQQFDTVCQELSPLSDVAELCVCSDCSFSLDKILWPPTCDQSNGPFQDGLTVHLRHIFNKLPVRRLDIASPRNIQQLWNVIRAFAVVNIETGIHVSIEGQAKCFLPISDIQVRASAVFGVPVKQLKVVSESRVTKLLCVAWSKAPIYVLDGHLVDFERVKEHTGRAEKGCIAYILDSSQSSKRSKAHQKPTNGVKPGMPTSRPIMKTWSNHVFKPGEPVIRKLQALEPFQEVLRGDEQVVGCFNKQFILLKAYDCLLLVDQHAAHERVRLEQFTESLFPGCETVEASIPWPGSAAALEGLGFVFEGSLIKGVPKIFEGENLVRGLEEMTDPLLAVPIRHVLLDLLKSKACRGAIMFGDELSAEAMRSLIKDLSRCKFPGICAHGRPSIRLLKL